MTCGRLVDRFSQTMPVPGHSQSRGSQRPAGPGVCLSPSQRVSSNEQPRHSLEDHYLGMQTRKGGPPRLRAPAAQSHPIPLFPTERAWGTTSLTGPLTGRGLRPTESVRWEEAQAPALGHGAGDTSCLRPGQTLLPAASQVPGLPLV